ncbi:division/cell wall cluster transcriptional repressor MraZ [Acutalibacter caecimuris]|uniref:division/cell wall cluster transcriptional repressor MraZ n=1 Tax=Acutalibacter caecimuris TaxID=3093657 RepID=UPI002AC8B58B|nr:division/cell wall cluster transcriptional repressor MraZ [Acutalibacter sp. M00118]
MLTGEYRHNMDPKGRVTMPSKFREDLGDRFFVCKGLDGCLFVLSCAQWAKLVEKVSAMPLSQGKGIQRYFFSGAAEVETDKQGRILIPQNLRDHAGLDKDVTVIGAAVRAEIWDTARWNDYNSSQTAEEIEESMNLLGF